MFKDFVLDFKENGKPTQLPIFFMVLFMLSVMWIMVVLTCGLWGTLTAIARPILLIDKEVRDEMAGGLYDYWWEDIKDRYDELISVFSFRSIT